MSKIICDICGTSYPETAERCPICGSARDLTLSLADEIEEEEIAPAPRPKGGRFAASNAQRKSSRRAVPEEPEDADEEDGYDSDDYDEDYDDYDEDYDEDEEYEDDDSGSNTPLVILLVVVIMALLAVTGFILGKYFLPNILQAETTTAATTQATTAATTGETTESAVPCESLVLTSGGEVLLEQEGLEWLLNVMALPEDTTDKIAYSSSDESVVTVNSEGKVTAVGEGEAVITVSCGSQSVSCNFTCSFDGTSATGETTEPEEADETLKDVTLKVIRWSDLTFDGPNQAFTFVLDGLSNTEVTWTSEDESIVTVDEYGYVVSVGSGQTNIICEYGDQRLEIPVNCRW